ncbi:MAG: 3-deoxy-manno-octulosonate cytidylyltransferase [Thermodesulfobacteriota bacterium]
MKNVAFIPARYGSSRFEGKPLALIAGRPMIQHVYERAASCRSLDGLYVATDDQRIFDCVVQFGGHAIMTDGRHRSGTDRIAEASDTVNLADNDIVVNIQGDQPLLPPASISELIAPLIEDPALPMSTLMYRIQDEQEVSNTNHVKVVVDNNGCALYFSRLPIPFHRDRPSKPSYFKHLGIYAYRKHFLTVFTKLPYGHLEHREKLEQLRALEHGYTIRVVETLLDSREVDTPEDIKAIEEMLAA